jgi:hypothetical protein
MIFVREILRENYLDVFFLGFPAGILETPYFHKDEPK